MNPLRVLLVEDSEEDALMLESELSRQGFDPRIHRVDTRTALGHALGGQWDVVLTDYALPGFSGLEAIALVRERAPHLPVIIMSGTVGDDKLVEAMKAGGADYILKGNLSRLGPAIRREMEDAEAARLRREAERARREAETQAAEALRKSEERYRQIVETAQEGIWVVDAKGSTTYTNRRMAEMLGTTVEDLLASSMFDFMAPEAREAAAKQLELRRSGREEQHEFRFRRRDGSTLWALLSTNPMVDGTGGFVGALAMVTDLTERRQLEAQLLQSQKMEAVGRLAGGVAHDFNNILGVITGYGQIVAKSLTGKDRPRMDEILKAAERAASLTRQLLSFSRPSAFEPAIVELKDVVTETDGMLRPLIREDIQLVTVVEVKHGRVRVDRGQIEQALMNLVVNARDAMPRGGTLTIETGNVQIDEGHARQHVGVRPGAYVMLAVSDTGIGMDEETRSHVFEPFYTTKEPGKGTGLGLATVYGIVKQSGGHISLSSEPGRGTTFKIYLPRVTEGAEPVSVPASPRLSELPRGSETVLVCEDEEALRGIVREILEGAGYAVLEAADGAEALHVVQRHEGPIDLLLSDVILPGMSGPELARSLVEMRPSLKVLHMSGHDDASMVHRGLLESGVAILPKPFAADVLLRKLRELLDGPP